MLSTHQFLFYIFLLTVAFIVEQHFQLIASSLNLQLHFWINKFCDII